MDEYFDRWMDECQLRVKAVPIHVYEILSIETAKRTDSGPSYTIKDVARALSTLGMSEYIDQVVRIVETLNYKYPKLEPRFTDSLESILRDMYSDVQGVLHYLRTRISFQYIMYKLLELNKYPNIHFEIPFKKPDKLNKMDMTWQIVCSANGWNFNPSN